MKVAIVGTHSVGKTTIVEPIAKQVGLDYVKESARDVVMELAGDANYSDQATEIIVQIQSKILQTHIENTFNKDNFICDRSELDVMAYSLYWLNYRKEKIATKFLDAVGPATKARCKLYDLFLLLPPTIPLRKDEVRHTSLYHRDVIHYMITGLLDSWRLPFYTIESISIDDRIKECSEVINRINAQNK